jgi:hypothetical protein
MSHMHMSGGPLGLALPEVRSQHPQRRHERDCPVGPDERFERLFSLLQKLCEPRVSSMPPRVRTPSRWRSAIVRRGSKAPSVPRNLRIRDACHAWVRLHSQASWGPPVAAARQPRTAVAVKGRDANTALLFLSLAGQRGRQAARAQGLVGRRGSVQHQSAHRCGGDS